MAALGNIKKMTFQHNIVCDLSHRYMLFLTCPEGGSLPVMVVMGEAGEARHAASVIVLEPFQEFT